MTVIIHALQLMRLARRCTWWDGRWHILTRGTRMFPNSV